MDPITQGLLGAACAQVATSKKLGAKSAALIGACAGMLPDLDILMARSDVLLGHQIFHRHFTHSLSFVPIGALLATLFFIILPRFRKQWKWVYLASFLGYLSHAPLDSFTSYGTLLFWPFSDVRISFDSLPIIDLVFTFVLFLGFLITYLKGSVKPVLAALVFCMLYNGFGFYQRNSVLEKQQEIAKKRGHTIERARALPGIGALVLWRGLYESNGKIYVDSYRAPYFKDIQIKEGVALPRYDISKAIRQETSPRLIKALKQFDHFTDQWTVAIPQYSTDTSLMISDFRYGLQNHKSTPLWGMRYYPNQPNRTPFMEGFRNTGRKPASRSLKSKNFAINAFKSMFDQDYFSNSD